MSMLLEDLLKKVPPETEDRVARAKERYNQPVRDALRHETGLRLNRPVRDQDPGSVLDKSENRSVKISIESGPPDKLRGKVIHDDDVIAALLIPVRNDLSQLMDSLQRVAEIIDSLPRTPQVTALIKGRHENIPPVTALADDLLKRAITFKMIEWILEGGEDVLGVYTFSESKDDPEGCKEGYIKLYWAMIGLISRNLGVSVDDLTAVVLTHELAHAYTHIGSDIDGERWRNSAFAKTETSLIEGLAQYYTQAVCRRIANSAPGSFTAYEELLKHQSEEYHAHEAWIGAFTPEEVRLALIETRRGGPGKMLEFNMMLKDASARLSTKISKDARSFESHAK
jgi:hypothetical protein